MTSPQLPDPQNSEAQHVEHEVPLTPPPMMGTGQAPMAPAKKKRGWIGWVIAGSVVVVLGILAVVGVSAYRFIYLPITAASEADAQRQQPEEEPDSEAENPEPVLGDYEVVTMESRPGFSEMQDYVTGLYDKYVTMEPEKLLEIYPGGKENYDEKYLSDYIWILSDLKSATRFLALQKSSDPGELDDRIAGFRARAENTEKDFLAGKDFDVEVSMTDMGDRDYYAPQETETADEGEDGEDEPAPDPAPTAAEAEQTVRDLAPYVGDDGTYRAYGEQVATTLGATVDYQFSDLYDHCTQAGILSTDEIGAVFCPVTPTILYVNNESSNFTNMISNVYYGSLIKHELSHKRIFEICGTMAPPIAADAGVHFEGVTNSYAVQLLNADRDLLSQATEGHPEYGMSDLSDQIASAVHDGNCSSL